MKINKLFFVLALGVCTLTLSSSCRISVPKGITSVQPFQYEKYYGTWFEIARMGVRKDPNLSNVTSTYSLVKDDHISIENNGYNEINQKWIKKKYDGYFVRKNHQKAHLKIYKKNFWHIHLQNNIIISIDEDYKYALVVGNHFDNLWIISREKTIPDSIKANYLIKAKALGIPIDKLIWTKQD